MIGAASYLIGFLIERFFINKKAKFKLGDFLISVLAGAIDGLLSVAKIGKLLGFVIVFLLELIPSVISGDNIYLSVILAFIIAITSSLLSGGISTKKLNKINKQLIIKLKKNNWKLIKDGIKTFFKKIKPHLKKYLSDSAFIAMFGVTNRSLNKFAVKRLGRVG